ncbi:MAG: hypothetical protein HZC28_11695 [Spirochaetes bacterium]|nr:hypothetical protein [Spirochaetota bacterium]
MSTSPVSALTAKVEVRNGAPLLVVNGTPVRPRIFWGHGFGSGGDNPLTGRMEKHSFSFDAVTDDSQCTLHLRFGEDSGTIIVDDIIITDDTSGKDVYRSDFEGDAGAFTNAWNYWCKDVKSPSVNIVTVPGKGNNASTGLQITLKKDDSINGFHLYSKAFPTVKDHRYTVSVRASSAPDRFIRPEVRHLGGDYRFYAGLPGPFVSEMKHAMDGGVNIVSFPVRLCWNEPGKEDYTMAISACEKVLSVNPKALLLPRINMNAPQWWRKSHPGTSMKYENGKENEQACVASAEYRTEAALALKRLIAVLEKRFGDSILGYHPAGQNTDEWFYYDSWKYPLCGYDEATGAAWLAKTGKNVPTPEERRAATGNIRHPEAQGNIIEFEKFRQESMTDMILALGRAIREGAPKKISMFFYGYLFEFAGVQNGPANSGHYAIGRLLASKDIDVLCAPISYFHRGLGGGTTVMTAAESVALSGKMWLNEDDTKTHLTKETSFPGWKDGGANLNETRNLLIRNIAFEAFRNIATWWMDLGGSGWFNDPALWADMKRFDAMDNYFMKNPTPYQPEVAVVIDEQSMRYIAASNAAYTTTRPLAYTSRSNFNLMGAPYGQYLIEDVIAGKVKAKMYVFVNALALSAQQRMQLTKAVGNATAVWCWLPGYIDGRQLSTSSVRDVTGFSVKEFPDGLNARVTATEAAQKYGITAQFGPDAVVRPMLSPVTEGSDEVIAAFSDGKPAIVIRSGKSGTSVFVATTELPQSLLRYIAKRAGVHLYSETDAVVCANGPYIAVHASITGSVTINARGTVFDAFSNEKIGGPEVTLDMKFGETRVLRVAR